MHFRCGGEAITKTQLASRGIETLYLITMLRNASVGVFARKGPVPQTSGCLFITCTHFCSAGIFAWTTNLSEKQR